MRKFGVLFAAVIVLAPATALPQDLCTVNAGDQVMTADEAKQKMIEAGYTDIRKVEEEHGCLEGKGFTADQKQLEVYVHPVSGEIVEVKIKD